MTNTVHAACQRRDDALFCIVGESSTNRDSALCNIDRPCASTARKVVQERADVRCDCRVIIDQCSEYIPTRDDADQKPSLHHRDRPQPAVEHSYGNRADVRARRDSLDRRRHRGRDRRSLLAGPGSQGIGFGKNSDYSPTFVHHRQRREARLDDRSGCVPQRCFRRGRDHRPGHDVSCVHRNHPILSYWSPRKCGLQRSLRCHSACR